ncbi:hypothetical protein Y032_0028g1674 [Ancylostoma ceylanicum]|uniref:NTF2 domain-containing protein n=1 Tax=Ancylostoma ceylanicum TaxID=53326 RepID=A0A016UUH0_9BILA|nr:hypothetical protein Y032_0028g1674 [Ancylostoma ceylanicum]
MGIIAKISKLELCLRTLSKILITVFQSLTFKQIQRAITKCDSQPLYDGSILVMVLGQLKTDDDPINPFSQIFILRPNTTGSFFIGNEIFRLDLHNN